MGRFPRNSTEDSGCEEASHHPSNEVALVGTPKASGRFWSLKSLLPHDAENKGRLTAGHEMREFHPNTWCSWVAPRFG